MRTQAQREPGHACFQKLQQSFLTSEDPGDYAGEWLLSPRKALAHPPHPILNWAAASIMAASRGVEDDLPLVGDPPLHEEGRVFELPFNLGVFILS